MTKILRSIRFNFFPPLTGDKEGYRLLNECPRARDITG